MDPSSLVTTVQAGGVMLWGIFSWPLSAKWASFKCHGLLEHCFWPCLSLWLSCTHPLMAASSRIMHHVTQLESVQIGFLNMKMSSLY